MSDDDETTESGGSGRSGSAAFGMSVNAEMSRKYGFEASAATHVTAKIVAMPPPTALLQMLDVSSAQIRELSERSQGMGVSPPPEVTEEEQQWLEFGDRWISAVEPVIGAVQALRQAYLDEGDDRSTEIAGMLETLVGLLEVAPDTTDGVETMRTLLESDEVVAAAEEENSFGLEVTVKAPLMAALDTAP